VPNLIYTPRKRQDVWWQVIVRVGENENFCQMSCHVRHGESVLWRLERNSLPAGAGDISDYLLAGPELFPALAFKDMDVKRQLCGPLLPWCEALISDRVV